MRRTTRIFLSTVTGTPLLHDRIFRGDEPFCTSGSRLRWFAYAAYESEKAVLMHRDGPLHPLTIGAAPGNRPVLQACLLLLGAGLLYVPMLSAQATGDRPAAAPAQPAVASNFVGEAVCATCHEDVVKGFASNPHTRMAMMHGSSGVTCENCHGAGKAHVDGGGDIAKIFNPTKATTKEVDAKCLSCHAGAHPNFERSPHARASVGCTSCHSAHASGATDHLLKAAQPALCYQCHTDVKPAFAMPFHHRVNEGLVQCTDCHDVHGTFGNNNIKSTADQNMICTKCHTETRGPFVYEHAAVKAEGCLGCHTPHGSQNARLLNMPNINTLCNQCHSPVAAGTVHGMNAGSSELTPCISCHTFIHGSNINAAFLR
jgi:DmsE family decaheme c-type cytochrome